jgi:AcrR family transcriptional regulator
MSTAERRKYDSPVRRQRSAETRERIVVARSELAHGFPRWDWSGLTVRAVARRADVNERTVYRHFGSERGLHEAVMRRLLDEAGDPLDGLTLDGLAPVVADLFAYLGSFATAPRTTSDPTFRAVDEDRRRALLDAVRPSTQGWPEEDRATAAALLDVLWSVSTHERLVAAWGLSAEAASRAVAGLVDALVDDIGRGRRPWVRE